MSEISQPTPDIHGRTQSTWKGWSRRSRMSRAVPEWLQWVVSCRRGAICGIPAMSRFLSGHRGHRRRNMGTSEFDPEAPDRRAWNAGRKVGAKRALKPRQVWAIRFFLDPALPTARPCAVRLGHRQQASRLRTWSRSRSAIWSPVGRSAAAPSSYSERRAGRCSSSWLSGRSSEPPRLAGKAAAAR